MNRNSRLCEHSHFFLMLILFEVKKDFVALPKLFKFLYLEYKNMCIQHLPTLFFIYKKISFVAISSVLYGWRIVWGAECQRWFVCGQAIAWGCMTNPINSTNECCRTYTIYVSSQSHCKYLAGASGIALLLSPDQAPMASRVPPNAVGGALTAHAGCKFVNSDQQVVLENFREQIIIVYLFI